jgi:hypothetical protein
MRMRLERVKYMPAALQPGVLYVAEEFGAAAHLCACGCGRKVRTPLSPTEWRLEETPQGPTLHPSVGNWQAPCRSHYVIRRGEICWAGQWTDQQILRGRQDEERRARAHFDELARAREGFFRRLWRRIRTWFGW